MKKYSWIFLLSIIVFLAFYLRITRLTQLYYFTHDEETIVWRVMPWLRDKNLFFLGGVTPFHVHLGPWFYYLSALILKLSQLNPLEWGIAAAILGSLTTIVVFITAKSFFNQKIGFISALLYATSFLMIAFDRHWWPLVLNPLVSLIVIFSLAKIVAKKYWYSLPLTLALALGFHTDPSTWALLFLTFYIWLKHNLPIKRREILVSVLIFLLSFLPLIVFDIKNLGTNILGIKKYLSETKPNQGLTFDRFVWTAKFIPNTLSRLIIPGSTDLTYSYSYCPQYSLTRINSIPLEYTLIVVLLLLGLYLKAKSPGSRIIADYFLIIIIGLNLYGNFFSSDLFDHYLTSLFPLFFIMLAATIMYIFNHISAVIAIVITMLIVGFNIYSFNQASLEFSYQDKLNAVNWSINKLAGRPFALDSLSDCFRYNGSRYLFTLQGHEPDISFVDPNFFWLYSQAPKEKLPNILIVFVAPDYKSQTELVEKYNLYKQHQLTSQQFNNIEVLLVDNSHTEFPIKY